MLGNGQGWAMGNVGQWISMNCFFTNLCRKIFSWKCGNGWPSSDRIVDSATFSPTHWYVCQLHLLSVIVIVIVIVTFSPNHWYVCQLHLPIVIIKGIKLKKYKNANVPGPSAPVPQPELIYKTSSLFHLWVVFNSSPKLRRDIKNRSKIFFNLVQKGKHLLGSPTHAPVSQILLQLGCFGTLGHNHLTSCLLDQPGQKY